MYIFASILRTVFGKEKVVRADRGTDLGRTTVPYSKPQVYRPDIIYRSDARKGIDITQAKQVDRQTFEKITVKYNVKKKKTGTGSGTGPGNASSITGDQSRSFNF